MEAGESITPEIKKVIEEEEKTQECNWLTFWNQMNYFADV